MVITPNTGRLPLSSQVIPERHGQHNLHCRIVVKVHRQRKPTLQNRSVESSILGGTTGWNMEVDLGKRLVFQDVVQKTLRSDIVLWSKTGKKLIVIELTVRCEEAYERKKAKYTELLDLVKGNIVHINQFL